MNSPDISLVVVARGPNGRFGVLRQAGLPFAVTLERTWDDATAPGGQRVVVPVGISHCRRSWFMRGNYSTFEIIVPGHTEVKFHILNVESQSEACIGVGESYTQFFPTPGSPLLGPGIADSNRGFNEFMRRTQGLDAFDLNVIEAPQIDIVARLP